MLAILDVPVVLSVFGILWVILFPVSLAASVGIVNKVSVAGILISVYKKLVIIIIDENSSGHFTLKVCLYIYAIPASVRY